MLGQLFVHDPTLRRAFEKTIFTATTYNLGPKTACEPHLDSGNLAFGWCAISALGDFDFTKGGHLILWELGLVVEFPPGSTALIPSALVTHSNTAISATENRYSFTQYAAGALFQWVDYDFQTVENYRATHSPHALQELDAANKNRWEHGLALLPRIPSVCLR